MAAVYVLFDGYSTTTNSEMHANCTCTYIKSQQNIIVDTMTAWDGEKILLKLNEHNIKPEEIDWVVCTHGHNDHTGNNNLFLNARHIVGNTISKRDHYQSFENEFIINEYVKVVATPGHTMSCVSVIVETADGCVAIVGDLFEKHEDLNDDEIWMRAGSEDPIKQKQNRLNILKIADFIIPGHGPKFPVHFK